jgi:DNA modification methylase
MMELDKLRAQIAGLQIALKPVKDLQPYLKNSRTHSEQQIAQIVRSMQEFGWTNPIALDGADGIVAGHGRLAAAMILQLDLVPTIDLAHLTPEQKRAYIIADNKLALNAGWNDEILKFELEELKLEGVDLTLTGFSLDELDELLEQQPTTGDGDPDDVPEEPKVPYSRPGQVWTLGPHRLCVGDSTNADDWQALMRGELADIAWTDPPYNVDVGRKNRLLDGVDGGSRRKTGSIQGDKLSDEDFQELIRGMFTRLHENMKPGASIYVAHSDKEAETFHTLFRDIFHFSQSLIWKKDSLVLGVADYQPIHEPIIYGWKEGSKHRWHGGRKQTTVSEIGGNPFSQQADGSWAVTIGDRVFVVDGAAKVQELAPAYLLEPRPRTSSVHPTQKPVGLVEKCIKNNARPGDILVDGCGGSGSTLIAGERMGMVVRIMEKEPIYADVIMQRYYEQTGRIPVDEATGELFPVKPKIEQQEAGWQR